MLNVVYSANDKYAPYLGISIFSLLKTNYHDFDNINIYVISNNILEKNIEKINSIIDRFSGTNMFIIPMKDIESLNNKNSDLDIAAYNRLFLGSLINKDNIEKFLYIDSDTIILGSLKNLWDLDINNYQVAGVQDLGGGSYPWFNPFNSDKYLNSGVLLINFREWKKLEGKFIEFIENTPDINSILHDQGVINGVIKDNAKLIVDLKYNVMNIDFNMYKKELSFFKPKTFYNQKIVENALKNPIIFHGKLWYKDFDFKELLGIYKKYVKLSPFEESQIFRGQEKSKFNKFYSFLISSCPNFLHFLLFRFVIYSKYTSIRFNKIFSRFKELLFP